MIDFDLKSNDGERRCGVEIGSEKFLARGRCSWKAEEKAAVRTLLKTKYCFTVLPLELVWHSPNTEGENHSKHSHSKQSENNSDSVQDNGGQQKSNTNSASDVQEDTSRNSVEDSAPMRSPLKSDWNELASHNAHSHPSSIPMELDYSNAPWIAGPQMAPAPLRAPSIMEESAPPDAPRTSPTLEELEPDMAPQTTSTQQKSVPVIPLEEVSNNGQYRILKDTDLDAMTFNYLLNQLAEQNAVSFPTYYNEKENTLTLTK